MGNGVPVNMLMRYWPAILESGGFLKDDSRAAIPDFWEDVVVAANNMGRAYPSDR